MQARILIVEHSLDQQKILTSLLGKNHFLTPAVTIAEARKVLEAGFFDLILLNTALPDGDGLSFCAELQMREETRGIPVIFITEQTEPNKEIIGFSLGAEDYIIAPLETARLRARLEARIKMLKSRKNQEHFFSKKDLKVSVTLQKVVVLHEGKEIPVELTPVEFKLILHLLRHEEHIFTREQLLTVIKGNFSDPMDRTVDMHISNLRKKISLSGFKIKSIHGTGYRLTYALPLKNEIRLQA
jgi:DNA-binding response OmpR family regulator